MFKRIYWLMWKIKKIWFSIMIVGDYFVNLDIEEFRKIMILKYWININL